MHSAAFDRGLWFFAPRHAGWRRPWMSLAMRITLGAIVAAILLLGCGLRFFQYAGPRGHSDEAITVEVVRHMRQSGDWDVNWKHADLSPDLRYDQYNFSSHLYATYFFYRFVKLIPGTLRWRSDGEGFLVYRFFSAALASLVIFQALHLGRKLGGRPAAPVAGILTAVATLLIQDAHYIRPEPFTTVLTLAAVALSLPSAGAHQWRPIAAGVCVGLLIACKISMAALVWLPFVPIVAAWRERSLDWRALSMTVAGVFGGFALGAPGAFTNTSAFVHGVTSLTTHYAGLHPPHSHLDGSAVADMMGRYFVATLGWPAIACFVVGIWEMIRQRAYARIAVVIGPVILFFVFFATRSVFFERNLSHVIPLVFVVAGVGVAGIYQRLLRRSTTLAWVGTSAICVVIAFGPAKLTLRFVGQEELSGKAAQNHERFEAALRAQHPEMPWMDRSLLTSEALDLLAAHFGSGGGDMVLKTPDYNDEWTARHLGLLQRRFHVLPLAEHPGIFPELPTCTLLTYHSTKVRYFRVRGSQAQ
jgi:hypothetical protein